MIRVLALGGYESFGLIILGHKKKIAILYKNLFNGRLFTILYPFLSGRSFTNSLHEVTGTSCVMRHNCMLSFQNEAASCTDV